jgi:hypothetical protein
MFIQISSVQTQTIFRRVLRGINAHMTRTHGPRFSKEEHLPIPPPPRLNAFNAWMSYRPIVSFQ